MTVYWLRFSWISKLCLHRLSVNQKTKHWCGGGSLVPLIQSKFIIWDFSLHHTEIQTGTQFVLLLSIILMRWIKWIPKNPEYRRNKLLHLILITNLNQSQFSEFFSFLFALSRLIQWKLITICSQVNRILLFRTPWWLKYWFRIKNMVIKKVSYTFWISRICLRWVRENFDMCTVVRPTIFVNTITNERAIESNLNLGRSLSTLQQWSHQNVPFGLGDSWKMKFDLWLAENCIRIPNPVYLSTRSFAIAISYWFEISKDA